MNPSSPSEPPIVAAPMANRSRKYRVWLVLGGVVILGIVLLVLFNTPTSSSSSSSAKPTRAPLIVPTTVRTRDMPIYLNALGTVTPSASVVVRARVDGQLLTVKFQEGQLVKIGEVLAEIDPRPYQAQLLQAQGQLARDAALLANARLDLARYQTLFAQDSISKQQLDSQAGLVKQYAGLVKMDQGALAAAELNLGYTRLLAPVTGRIGLRLIDPGNIVRAADPNGLVVINTTQPTNVVFAIPEPQLSGVMQALRQDQKTVVVQAYDRTRSQILATGQLLAIDNQIDPTTGTIKLKAIFTDPEQRLFPQQFVNVQLLLRLLKDAVVVPSAAVQQGSQGPFVYRILPDKTVTMQPVHTGVSDAQDTVILAGLTAGQQIVLEGNDKLSSGATITLTHAAANLSRALASKRPPATMP